MATVNKQAIVAAFDRVAILYEQHANLQRQNTDVLLAILPQHKYTHVMDVGYGPGWMNRHRRGHHTQVTALDLSPSILVQTRQEDAANYYPAEDIEFLPLATATFDLAWSNLTVQWCGNLSMTLRELYQVVRLGGVVASTTLVQGSLPEPYQAWQVVDEHPHVNRFLPPDEIGQSLNGAHYQHRIQPITLWFDDALSIMRSLKGVSATYLHGGRDPWILTRS